MMVKNVDNDTFSVLPIDLLKAIAGLQLTCCVPMVLIFVQ